jgi:3-oxoadipate enol-lactonase
MPTLKVNDITMYYEVHGRGEPLLLINGLGADVMLLKPITEALSKRYRVIVFDNRGAGRTDKPDAPYSMDMMADDAAGLLDALKIPTSNVMGISMGGRIAISLALRYPKKVKHLILVSTSARGYGRLKMSWQFRVLSLFAWLPVFRGAYAQPKYAHNRQRQATVNFNATAELDEITAPTLILHGEKDKSVPLELAEETYAGIRGSKIKIFKGGHIFFLMRGRKEFIAAVTSFI